MQVVNVFVAVTKTYNNIKTIGGVHLGTFVLCEERFSKNWLHLKCFFTTEDLLIIYECNSQRRPRTSEYCSHVNAATSMYTLNLLAFIRSCAILLIGKLTFSEARSRRSLPQYLDGDCSQEFARADNSICSLENRPFGIP